MSAAATSMKTLSTAICLGVSEGNKPLLAALLDSSNKRHEIRGDVDSHGNKIAELDGEIKLLKSTLVSLIGGGDGSTGSVPALQREVKALGENVIGLSGQVSNVQSDMTAMNTKIDTVISRQSANAEESARFQGGIAVGKWFIVKLVAAASGAGAMIAWLFTHGLHF